VRDRAPARPRAQVNYDCWVEQQAEGWQFDPHRRVQDGFWRFAGVSAPPLPVAQLPSRLLVF
jgi:hypothetical protein